MTTPVPLAQLGARTTALEVVQGLDLTGRTMIVTGGAGGIGIETARALASAGAAVTIATRDLEAAERAAADVTASIGNARVRGALLDLTDLDSVDAFVDAWEGPLDVLVNNAGVMDTPHRTTKHGWELQLATNHLGHVALTLGLHDALAAADGARVVSVSSSGHAASPVVLDDLMFERRPYDPGLAYGQSKTANVLFAVELTRRWTAEGITADALMPGGIWTGLQKHWDPAALAELKERTKDLPVVKSPEQGAATSVLLAVHPEVVGSGGRYFEDCHEAEVVDRLVDGVHGVLPHALDPVAATALWDRSLELLAEAGHPARRA
jgi:NAD(P)-dependent dehydrogenase (short-subunit alcohol dehydrogenase family)